MTIILQLILYLFKKQMEIKVSIPEEYAKIYMMLVEKLKQEHKNATEQEIHNMIFKDAIAYMLLS